MTTEAEEVKKKKKAEEEEKKEKAEFDEEDLQRCGTTEEDFAERLQKIGMKLTLWCTRTFRPLTTHGEIEPIMATLGFFPLPLYPNPITTNFNNITVVWKEYNHPGAYAISTRPGAFPSRPRLTVKTPPPTPRLTYPRIDGLNILTYRAFLDSINFYHNKEFVSDHFHVRAVPFKPIHDQHMTWVYVKARNTYVLFRQGTLDVSLKKLYLLRSSEGKEIVERDDYEDDDPKITMVSMDDIIVTDKK